MKKALVTFVRAPEMGKVKTRLQKDLGPEKTLRIYKQFIREVLTTCSQISGVSRLLACAPSDNDSHLKRIAREFRLTTFSQVGDSLGNKIVNGFNHCFEQGFSMVVIIGSDSPTIPVDYINMAFRLLRKHEFVVGPCCDGGMYLVGAKDRVHNKIFRDIPWDTSEVLNMVMEGLYRYRINFGLLPFWYDVDDINDYRFLELHLKYLSFPQE